MTKIIFIVIATIFMIGCAEEPTDYELCVEHVTTQTLEYPVWARSVVAANDCEAGEYVQITDEVRFLCEDLVYELPEFVCSFAQDSTESYEDAVNNLLVGMPEPFRI